MKAAVLRAFGSPLSIEAIPDPILVNNDPAFTLASKANRQPATSRFPTA